MEQTLDLCTASRLFLRRPLGPPVRCWSHRIWASGSGIGSLSTAETVGDEPIGLTVLGSPDNPLEAQVARSVADAYVAQLNADRLSVHAALAAGVPPSRTAELAKAVAGLRLPESVEARTTGYRQLTTASYYAPAMGSIMFILFAIGFTAHS